MRVDGLRIVRGGRSITSRQTDIQPVIFGVISRSPIWRFGAARRTKIISSTWIVRAGSFTSAGGTPPCTRSRWAYSRTRAKSIGWSPSSPFFFSSFPLRSSPPPLSTPRPLNPPPFPQSQVPRHRLPTRSLLQLPQLAQVPRLQNGPLHRRRKVPVQGGLPPKLVPVCGHGLMLGKGGRGGGLFPIWGSGNLKNISPLYPSIHRYKVYKFHSPSYQKLHPPPLH